MSKIDLGRKPQDLVTILSPENGDRTHYPDLCISDTEDSRIAEMPDEGEMTVHYKVKSRTHHEDKRNGKKRHTCSIVMDITHIEPPAPRKKKNGDSDGGARKAISEYFKDK